MKNIKALKRIFEASESIEYSSQELDEYLKEINIDPKKLVGEGLERIEKLIGDRGDKLIPMRGDYLKQFPIAASKKKSKMDILKKKIDEENSKNQ